MERIGIFGGTFNPPHLGHQNLLTGFLSRLELDRVLVIPSAVPPHKAAPDLASGEDRMELCRRTFRDPRVTFSRMELDRTGKSYTVDTLRAIKEEYGPDSELFFLVGDDMLLYFDHWREPDTILSLCTLVASVRSDRTDLTELEAYAEEQFPEQYEAGRFRFLFIPPFEASSTEIRERIRRDRKSVV